MYAFTRYLTGVADDVIHSGCRVRVNAPTWADAHRLGCKCLESFGYARVVVDDTYPDGPTDEPEGIVSC